MPDRPVSRMLAGSKEIYSNNGLYSHNAYLGELTAHKSVPSTCSAMLSRQQTSHTKNPLTDTYNLQVTPGSLTVCWFVHMHIAQRAEELGVWEGSGGPKCLVSVPRSCPAASQANTMMIFIIRGFRVQGLGK